MFPGGYFPARYFAPTYWPRNTYVPISGLDYTAIGRLHWTVNTGYLHWTVPAEDL